MINFVMTVNSQFVNPFNQYVFFKLNSGTLLQSGSPQNATAGKGNKRPNDILVSGQSGLLDKYQFVFSPNKAEIDIFEEGELSSVEMSEIINQKIQRQENLLKFSFVLNSLVRISGFLLYMAELSNSRFVFLNQVSIAQLVFTNVHIVNRSMNQLKKKIISFEVRGVKGFYLIEIIDFEALRLLSNQ